MKLLLVILFLIPAAGSFAQSDSSQPELLYRMPDNSIDSITPYKKILLDQKNMKAWLDSSRITRTTQRGTIYKMPVDNMPCLVPDKNKTEKYWGVKPSQVTKMPNAFRGKKQ